MEKENIGGSYSYDFYDRFQFENLEDRRIYLNCEIDFSVIDDVVYHILRYNRLDKGIPKENRKPIILYINSPGGSLVDGYGVIDAILLSETPVYTVNVAQASSMGFLIYIAGDKRFAFPHSEFLMHDGNVMGLGSTSKVKDRMEFETIQLEDMTKMYVLERTKITKDIYNERYRYEWYMLSDEAKRFGIVDYIVGEDCPIDDIL